MKANEYKRASQLLNNCSNFKLYTPKFEDFKTASEIFDTVHIGYRGMDTEEKRIIEIAITRFKLSFNMGTEDINTEFAYGVGVLYTNTEEDNWQDRQLLNKKQIMMFIKLGSIKGTGIIAISTDAEAEYIQYYAVHISNKSGKDSGDFRLISNKAN